jgi:hypothetical protein
MPLLTFDAELQPYINQLGDTSLPQTQRQGNGYSKYTPAMGQKLSDPPADGVAMPSDARSAFMFVKGGGIRVRTDGIPASNVSGLYIPAGTLLVFKNQRQTLEQWQMADSLGETAELSCMWFA